MGKLDSLLAETQTSIHFQSQIDYVISQSNCSSLDAAGTLELIGLTSNFRDLGLTKDSLLTPYRAMLYIILSLSPNASIRDYINPKGSRENTNVSFLFEAINNQFSFEETMDITTALEFFARKLGFIELSEMALDIRQEALNQVTSEYDDEVADNRIKAAVSSANHRVWGQNKYFGILLERFQDQIKLEA